MSHLHQIARPESCSLRLTVDFIGADTHEDRCKIAAMHGERSEVVLQDVKSCRKAAVSSVAEVTAL